MLTLGDRCLFLHLHGSNRRSGAHLLPHWHTVALGVDGHLHTFCRQTHIAMPHPVFLHHSKHLSVWRCASSRRHALSQVDAQLRPEATERQGLEHRLINLMLGPLRVHIRHLLLGVDALPKPFDSGGRIYCVCKHSAHQLPLHILDLRNAMLIHSLIQKPDQDDGISHCPRTSCGHRTGAVTHICSGHSSAHARHQ